MESIFIFLIAIFILIIISGFFAAAETAITGVSQSTIHKLKSEGNKKAIIVSDLREDKERLIGAVLLVNSACNSAISAIAAIITIKLFNSDDLVLYSTIIITIIIFIFAEVLPKTYAFENSESLALTIAKPLSLVVKILYPITTAVQYAVNFVLSSLNIKNKSGSIISATEKLRGAIELHHKEGSMIKSDRDMLGSILDLADTEVSEIMIHRKNMMTIDIDSNTIDIIKEILDKNHTRVPVWRNDPDNIIGILNVKDLLKEINKNSGDFSKICIEDILTTPWYIPGNTLLKEQLHEFRKRKIHFALVIDEYGDLKGLVSLEDIIEEIVGQIEDEHDTENEYIKSQSDGSYIIRGDTSIRDINRELDWELPFEEANTLAGLIMHETEMIPDEKDKFNLYNMNIEILKKENNHIEMVKINKIYETN